MDDRDDPQTFYDEYGRDEWTRLEESVDGRLEFDRTVATLDETLPEGGSVLDAGGGAGRYSIWLAERGHEVTLLDLSREQVRLAREQVERHGVAENVTLSQGTITDLGFDANAFDATCCLGGALSHVLDAGDRRRAAAELRRVTAPDAPVFVSVMGRLGAVQLYLLTGHHLEALPELLEHGDYDADLLEPHGYDNEFTATHFFRRDELDSLLMAAGVTVTDVVGLEGLASPFHDAGIRENVADVSDGERAALERAVRETNGESAVADLSVHMLAVGRA